MGKAFTKGLFKEDPPCSCGNVLDCPVRFWSVKGFPHIEDEVKLNGCYEYVGDKNGFPSYRLMNGRAMLYVDPSDGFWALGMVMAKRACLAYSTHHHWRPHPPATGWALNPKYLHSGHSFELLPSVVMTQCEAPDLVTDLRVVGFPEQCGLNGLYKWMGYQHNVGLAYVQADGHCLFQKNGLWAIVREGDWDKQVAFSTRSQSAAPPCADWRVQPRQGLQGDCQMGGLEVVSCVAFIPRLRTALAAALAPVVCACGRAFPDSDALVRHRRADHGAPSVWLPLLPLVLVFGYVPYRDLQSIALVCGQWHRAYCSEHMWQPLCGRIMPFFCWAQSFCIDEAECAGIGAASAQFYASMRRRPTDAMPPEGGAFDDEPSYTKFQQVVKGQRTCLAEVFDKHMRDGFKMTVYDAFIFFRGFAVWNALYLQPTIPRQDESKCYFEAELLGPDRLRHMSGDCRLYNPYEPHFLPMVPSRDLGSDVHVEIQYRFREEDPYGWWKGLVQSYRVQPNGTQEVVVYFPQYKDNPKWANETVILGQKNLKPMAFKKQQSVGGIRLCTAQQTVSWSKRQQIWQF